MPAARPTAVATRRLLRTAVESLEPRRLLAGIGATGTTLDGSAIPIVDSYAAATHTLYIDFDGEDAFSWENGVDRYDTGDRPAWRYSTDSIRRIAEAVGDIYAAFDLNVTTRNPALPEDHDAVGAVRVLVGGDNFARPSESITGAGVAAVGTFGNAGHDDLNTAFAFITDSFPPADDVEWVKAGKLTQAGESLIAWTIAHEAGHQFGLAHEKGQNPGDDDVLPHSIMEYPSGTDTRWFRPDIKYNNIGIVMKDGATYFPKESRDLDDDISLRTRQNAYRVLANLDDGLVQTLSGISTGQTGPGLRVDDVVSPRPLPFVDPSNILFGFDGVIGLDDTDVFLFTSGGETQETKIDVTAGIGGAFRPVVSVEPTSGQTGVGVFNLAVVREGSHWKATLDAAKLPAGDYRMTVGGRDATGARAYGGYTIRATRQALPQDVDAPLYVITHGAVLDGVGAPPWLGEMALAISDRLGLGLTSEGVTAATLSRFDSGSVVGADLPQGAEHFVLYDWSSLSGLADPGKADHPEVAGELARLVSERLADLSTGAGQRDVHFIGHSRGAYVINAAIDDLADSALSHIGFLQQTTLDAQSYGTDGFMDVPDEVDLADNYYQTQDLLEGFRFGRNDPRMLNVDITPMVSAWKQEAGFDTSLHSAVRNWYHWTIDTGLSPRTYDGVDRLGADAQSVLATRELLYPDAARFGGINAVTDLDLDGTADVLDLGNEAGFYYSRAFAFNPEPDQSYLGLGGFDGVDLVLVIDTTASMQDDIDAVADNANDLLDDLAADDPNFQLGIVTFRDVAANADYVSRTELPMTNDVAAIRDAIERVRQGVATEGSEGVPETVLSGLMHAYDMKDGLGAWRGTTSEGTFRKTVILFGDAPAKEGPYVDRQTGDANGYTLSSVATRAFNVDPVDTFGIFVEDDEYDADIIAAARSDFQSIARAARGRTFEIDDAGQAAAALSQAITSIVNTARAELLDSTVLDIRGSEDADDISVARDGSGVRVTVNGLSETFFGDVGEIRIEANGGGDTVTIGDGLPYARIFGGDGDDTITGGEGRDAIYGGAGDDELRAGDTTGRPGDHLEGGDGDDTLFGSNGDDTLDGGLGDDSLEGGDGIDAVSYAARDAADDGDGFLVFMDFEEGDVSGEDEEIDPPDVGEAYGPGGEVDSLRGFEQFLGSPGDDQAYGSAAGDFLIGLGGNDLLIGRGGGDTLLGGEGQDTLDGGEGRDLLIALADHFADEQVDSLFGDETDLALLDDDDDREGLLAATSFSSVDEYLDYLGSLA